MKLGDRLKIERERHTLTQSQVAEAVGTATRTVSRWERGESLPQPYFREKLCELFGLSAEELGFLARYTDDDPPLFVSAPLLDPLLPAFPNNTWELVGRADLLTDLCRRLCSHENVALHGLPGAGKTALAIALARDERVRACFPDGVLWAGLGPHPNPQAQLSRWGRLLGISLSEIADIQDTDAWIAALRFALDNKCMLLVIDDAWELLPALTFKLGINQCAHLLTTRFPAIALRFAREHAIAVHELDAHAGLALLNQLAPQAVHLDAGAAQMLVEEVGGLPLALTLMGKYLQRHAYGGQPRRIRSAITHLRNAQQRLQLSEPLAPVERPSLSGDTPLSLQTAIAVSDHILDEQARSTLRALSAFPSKPNTFSEEAAVFVSQAPVETLDALSDASLLESSGPGRYTLHQTIADYAQANLNLTETVSGVRLIAYMLNFVEAHWNDYLALERECLNILAALTQAFVSGQQMKLVRGVLVFAPFLLDRGLYDLASLHLQRAYTTAIWQRDKPNIALILLFLGKLALRKGEYGQAESYLRDGLSGARALEHKEHICHLLTILSSLALCQKDLAAAQRYAQEGLLLARQSNNALRICELLCHLATVASEQKEYMLSDNYLREALTLARSIDSPQTTSEVQRKWGELQLTQDQFDAAAHHFEQALEHTPEGYLECLAQVQYGLARVAYAQGNLHGAQEHGSLCLSNFEKIGHGLAYDVRNWLASLTPA